MYIAVYVAISFFTAHYLFRWRTAMVEWYHSVYDKARKIEGASQRVQEDTIKFSRIMEGLGTSFIESFVDRPELYDINMLKQVFDTYLEKQQEINSSFFADVLNNVAETIIEKNGSWRANQSPVRACKDTHTRKY